MADLTAVEKRKIEKFLGLKTGYVLNFSNRGFEEFVRGSVGRNIFDGLYNYGSGSKANRLRAFCVKEDNAVVGKLLNDLIDCTEQRGEQAEMCRLIATRLLKDTGRQRQPLATPEVDSLTLKRAEALHELKEQFLRLAAESDRNQAGLSLEKLLNSLFELFELHPRQPFRVVGEQIDGSFQLDGQIYLLESKWEKDPLPEGPLLVFRGKIEGKSTFTRGVMIALNDVSAPAREAITRGKAPNFFVVNGHDLMMILSEAVSLTDFLRKRVRLLAEEGRVCVQFSESMR